MSNYLPDLRQGDEYILQIDTSADTYYKDLTGYKAWFTLKKEITDLDEQAAFSISAVAGSDINDDPQNGKMYLIVPSSVMRHVEAGEYFYDVQIKRPDVAGEGIKTLLPPWDDPDDKIKVLPEITRAID